MHCDSNFLRSIVLCSVSVGMNSPIGRNVAHCSVHHNLCIDSIGDSKLSSCNCLKICSYNDLQLVARANILREVLLIRDGLLAF